MKHKQVVTWMTPGGIGDPPQYLNVCRSCKKDHEKKYNNFCQVHEGLHKGYCDICQPADYLEGYDYGPDGIYT